MQLPKSSVFLAKFSPFWAGFIVGFAQCLTLPVAAARGAWLGAKEGIIDELDVAEARLSLADAIRRGDFDKGDKKKGRRDE